MVLARTKIVKNSFENVKRHIEDLEDSIKMAISKEEVKLLITKLRDIEKKVFNVDDLYRIVAGLSDKVSHYPEEAIKILAEKIKHNIDYFEKRINMQESEFISRLDGLKDNVSNLQKKNINRLRDFFEERLNRTGNTGDQNTELKELAEKIKDMKKAIEMQNREIERLNKAIEKNKE